MGDSHTITVLTRGVFRSWLKIHHAKERRVGVIVYKRHTGKPAPTHRELIEEAICFGWIDTTIKRIDDNTFLRNFARRSSASKWSDNTLAYAKQLIREGKMTPMGLAAYKLGRSRPTHDHGIPKNPDMPVDLRQALSKNQNARVNFNGFSPSTKRTLYRWLLRAKLPETRAKRVAKIMKSILVGNRNILRPTQQANS
jgi:uncharacterized protein YdeI (YjbR/CyaY-like superfamily)